MKKIITVLVVILIVGLSGKIYPQQPSSKELLDKMILAMDNVKSARYSLRKEERINGLLFESMNVVKLQLMPYKIYLYSIKPNPGAEVLWIKGENGNDVLVNPAKFPFMNINLSPYNGLLRQNQHHTILDLGFGFMSSVLKSSFKKYGNNFYASLSYDGEVLWNGKNYYKLIIDNDNFTYIDYVVQKDETLPRIAEKNYISDYMILMANPQLKGFDNVKAGQKIKIPNSYARKIIFYVDKEKFLPFMQVIYDEKGIYEKYEFTNFILNPSIPAIEFTPKFKDYHF